MGKGLYIIGTKDSILAGSGTYFRQTVRTPWSHLSATPLSLVGDYLEIQLSGPSSILNFSSLFLTPSPPPSPPRGGEGQVRSQEWDMSLLKKKGRDFSLPDGKLLSVT
jgi:hypothetical protein